MRTIVLASASPRRKKLLEGTGLKFIVCPSNYEEIIDEKLLPDKLAEKLSLEKARDVFRKYPNCIIIAADTFVVIDGKIFGKPKDIEDAKRMLKFLSGKIHTIMTGFTIIDEDKIITKSERTKIYMRNISQTEIEKYAKTKEPYDKAGAYATQGWARKYITKIDGDESNAIGLPIKSLLRELNNLKQ